MASPTAQAAPPAFTFPGSLYNGVSSYGGKGPEVLAVSWFFCALTLIVIGLRTYTTVFIIRRPRIDLWIMLVALVCPFRSYMHSRSLTELFRYWLAYLKASRIAP